LPGIRDLTIIESPPTARLAVKTIIKPWADDIVIHALQREVPTLTLDTY
jgi:transcription-repair coupling factor (superfamily II helicase)